MSDSDETVCNESGDDNENTENSPSILSNWHQNKAVFPTTRNENSPKNNLEVEHEKTSNDANSDDIVQRSEGSPEFPLIVRGLKRKGSFDETEDTNPDVKETHSEANSTQNPDQNETKSSTESGNICSSNITCSQTKDEDEKLENLLNNMEELVKDMEITCEREGEISNFGALQDAKCRLSDIQKLLVESNRKNQAKRKMATADAEDSQQLDDSKKLVIVNLVKRQRHLLEAFKNYKNLVERLKAMKERSSTPQRSGKLSEIQSFQVPSQSSQNVSKGTTNGSVSTSSSDQPSAVSSVSQNLPKHSPRLVTITNTTNSALTEAIKKGSVKFIVLQTQNNNTNSSPNQSRCSTSVPKVASQTLSDQSNTTPRLSVGFASRPQQPSTRQCAQTTGTAKDAPFPEANNTTGSKKSNIIQRETLNMPMTLLASQIQTTACTSKSPNTVALGKCATLSSINQSNPQSSMLRTLPSTFSSITTSENLTPTANYPTNQSNVARTQSQAIRNSVACSNRLGTNQTSFQPSTATNPLIPVSTSRRKQPFITSKTTSLAMQSQNISSSGTSINRSGMNKNSRGSLITTNTCPFTPRQTASQTNRLTTNQLTSLTTQSPNISGSMLSINCSGMNQNTSQILTKTTPSSVLQHQNLLPPRNRQPSADLPRVSNYTDSQSNTRQQEQATIVKQTSGLPLSLDTLVKNGVLAPGKDVLTATSEGKLYSASLSDKGTIISAGGEGFTSPRSWVKAILGSKRKIKNELAWKMVSYKNKPLLDHAATIASEPSKSTEKSVNYILEGVNQGAHQTRVGRNNTRRELINTAEALKVLLSNCGVIGVRKEDVLSSDNLQKDFWENDDAEWLKNDISEALKF